VSVKDTIASGEHSFITTAVEDSVSIPGAVSTDDYIATPREASPSVNDFPSCTTGTGKLYVWRNAGGTSGETYTYFRVRRK